MKMEDIRKSERNRLIKIDRDNGMTYRAIASKYSISAERVRTILKREEKEESFKSNMTLFQQKIYEISGDRRLLYLLSRAGISTEKDFYDCISNNVHIRSLGNKGLETIGSVIGKKLQFGGYYDFHNHIGGDVYITGRARKIEIIGD